MSVRPESTSRTITVWSTYMSDPDHANGAGIERLTATATDICGHSYERRYFVPRAELADYPDLRAAVSEVLRRLNGAMDECESSNGR